MGKVLDSVNASIVPIIEGMGYEVVEVEYAKKYNEFCLTFFIHKAGGITLDDCEAVSRAIDAPLDELDPTQGAPYNLNVSSPGLDRPIKTDKDFARNAGTMVEVKLYAAIDKKKVICGTLIGKTDEGVELELGNGRAVIPLNNVAIIKPYVDFKNINKEIR